MGSMKKLIEKLSPLRMAPNSNGLDMCVKYLCEELDFKIHTFPGGAEVNGWVVPMKWEVEKAEILLDGKMIYDGMHHPLAVIGYSQPFEGKVSGLELKKHLFYPNAFDDALVYHCDLFYKPFRKEWGFSVTKNFYDTIIDQKEYEIHLKTTFETGSMKVIEYVLPGELEESIIFNAHNCHAFCCNDDLAGVACGIELFKKLRERKSRRFTYRLVIAPEHFGSIFYLNQLSDKESKNIKYATFLEMVGAGGPLALQRSFKGNTWIDRAYALSLKHYTKNAWSAPFRKIVGNDETCWDSVGYNIPCPSLSRSDGKGHFPEYHTSRDSPALINDDLLNEALSVVEEAIFIMENDSTMIPKFKGLVSLSHPKFDLYKSFWDPSEQGRKSISDTQRSWNYLMDCLPRYFDGNTRIIEISEKHQLPFKAVYEYVYNFFEKGLIEMKYAPIEDPEIRELPPL